MDDPNAGATAKSASQQRVMLLRRMLETVELFLRGQLGKAKSKYKPRNIVDDNEEYQTLVRQQDIVFGQIEQYKLGRQSRSRTVSALKENGPQFLVARMVTVIKQIDAEKHKAKELHTAEQDPAQDKQRSKDRPNSTAPTAIVSADPAPSRNETRIDTDSRADLVFSASRSAHSQSIASKFSQRTIKADNDTVQIEQEVIDLSRDGNAKEASVSSHIDGIKHAMSAPVSKERPENTDRPKVPSTTESLDGTVINSRLVLQETVACRSQMQVTKAKTVHEKSNFQRTEREVKASWQSCAPVERNMLAKEHFDLRKANGSTISNQSGDLSAGKASTKTAPEKKTLKRQLNVAAQGAAIKKARSDPHSLETSSGNTPTITIPIENEEELKLELKKVKLEAQLKEVDIHRKLAALKKATAQAC